MIIKLSDIPEPEKSKLKELVLVGATLERNGYKYAAEVIHDKINYIYLYYQAYKYRTVKHFDNA